MNEAVIQSANINKKSFALFLLIFYSVIHFHIEKKGALWPSWYATGIRTTGDVVLISD